MRNLLKRIQNAMRAEDSAAQRLQNLIKEQRKDNLLRDLESIRRSGNFVPDYNKPKLYMDYILVVDFPTEKKQITSNTKVGHDRPEDFGNDITAWIQSIRDANKKAEEERLLEEAKVK